ncbi:MAG: MarR family winged helix-turn-helix transcriptional regulator [Acidimicrobiales bacterium]
MGKVPSMDEVSYCSVGWTAARLARQVEVALATLDLSPAQYRMLVQIARGTDASSSLAQKLAVSAPSVTAVVDGLVQRGAVERAHSVEDRRRIALALTGLGRALLAAAEEALQARLEAIAGELENGDLATSALSALALWGEALDRARAKREAARRAEGAETPP